MNKPIYLNNKHLYGLMIRYRNQLLESRENKTSPPKIPSDIGQSIMLICSNLIKKGNFSGYSSQYREEMMSDGMMDCVAAIDNFDPDKTNNPFAYFTQIAWNAYIRRIQKEKKQQYIKLKNYEQGFILGGNYDYFDQTQHQFNEITSEAIKNYEEKYLVKPELPKKKRKEDK
jgi:Sigma-70 region 2